MKKEFTKLRIVTFINIFLICLSLYFFYKSNIKDYDINCIDNCKNAVNWTAMKFGMYTIILTIITLIIYITLYIKLVIKKSKIKAKRHI